MDAIIELTESLQLERDYLAEFLQTRRVPQNLFYTREGAEAFYLYRQPDFEELCCEGECTFFSMQHLWEPCQSVAFVSLGCGNGEAEKALLCSLSDEGTRLHYFGVDSSRTMLELACSNLQKAQFTSDFVLADFTAPDFGSRLRALTAGHDVRVYAMMGATFGNFDQEPIVRILGGLLEPGDYLYLDVVPRPDEVVSEVALRNRLSRLPENMEVFFNGLLERLCIDRAAGEVFGREVAEEQLGAIRYTFCFQAEQDICLPYFDGSVALRPGDCIELLTIRAYDPQALAAFVAQHGFELVDSFMPDVGRLNHRWQRLLFRRLADGTAAARVV